MQFINISLTTITKQLVQDAPLKRGYKIVKHENIRSAIYDEDGSLVVFSPLSGDSPSGYFEDATLKPEIRLEKYVEGTMINLFFHNNEWVIATKNSVGGNNSFYIIGHTRQMSFRTMFDECCQSNNIVLDNLNTRYIYSFVMQHTNNRIINKFDNNQLYLIAVYAKPDEPYPESISMVKDVKTAMPELGFSENTSVKTPDVFDETSKDIIEKKFATPYTDYLVMGVHMFNTVTGTRSKLRNPAYEELKKLRGNQAKVEYHYIALRKQGRVDEFLDFFPEYTDDFNTFECKIQNFQHSLFEKYNECYLNKKKPLKEYEPAFKSHMYAIHEDYKLTKESTKMNTIIDYTQNLPEAVLMSSVNRDFRAKTVSAT